MNKSVIIFGSPESVHMQRFINLLLDDASVFSKIVVFNISRIEKLSNDDLQFYNDKDIEIITGKYKNYRSRVFRAAMNYFIRKKALKKNLKQNGRYNYCFIHFCAWQNVMWVNATQKYYAEIIPVFYGGDVLRNEHLNTKIYKKFLSYSSHIILPNEHSFNVFMSKTNARYKEKTHAIQFPNGVCEKMMAAEKKVDRIKAKQQFYLPLDKRIVICGHTATRAEQYEKMIDQLVKCNDFTLNSCFFVFMMTYAPDNYRPYQDEIEQKLKQTRLKFLVLKEFIKTDDIINLHFASDIHITTIKTDAFSCFLQEELMAGNMLLYGKWLNYHEIENNDFYAITFQTFNDLPKCLDIAVEKFDELSQKTDKNKKSLMSIKSNDAIKEIWNKRIFCTDNKK